VTLSIKISTGTLTLPEYYSIFIRLLLIVPSISVIGFVIDKRLSAGYIHNPIRMRVPIHLRRSVMAKDDVKKKAAELIRSNRYSKLITFGTDGAPHGRIMTNLPLGNDMVIWFATGLSTNKIKDIKKNPTVSVFVDDPTNQKNASIIGKAEIVTDGKLRKKFWQEVFGFFFPGGPTDPDYCLLKITPKKVEYLDPGLTFYQTRVRTIITV